MHQELDLFVSSFNKALKFSLRERKPSLSRAMLNPCILILLLFCLGIARLLSFYKCCSYCQVLLTSILRVTTISIRIYQFRNKPKSLSANSCNCMIMSRSRIGFGWLNTVTLNTGSWNKQHCYPQNLAQVLYEMNPNRINTKKYYLLIPN